MKGKGPGKGKCRNFIVTFHDDGTGYTSCLGAFKKFTTALGEVYDHIYDRQLAENSFEWRIQLPVDAEGQNAWVVSYSYKEKDGQLFDNEYYLIYDNRPKERSKNEQHG